MLDPSILKDLKHSLKLRLKEIIQQYSSYVRLICKSLKEKRGPGGQSFLLIVQGDLKNLSAFNHIYHKEKMLNLSHSNNFEDLILGTLSSSYASFLNCEIFQFLVDKYNLDDGDELFQYPKKHLKDFLKSHKISNFKDINPWLNKPEHSSTQLVLKLDIEVTAELSKFLDVHEAVARALGLNSAALRIIDIKDGCVIVTFLISPNVAKILFNEHTSLTEEQVEAFQALSALWLKCNGYSFYFQRDDEEKTFSTIPRYDSNWLITRANIVIVG